MLLIVQPLVTEVIIRYFTVSNVNNFSTVSTK